MGRDRDRSKKGIRPSSSQQAASRFSSGFSFSSFGFGLSSSAVDQDLPSELRVVFSKLSKRDTATVLRGLTEISELLCPAHFQEASQAILAHWENHYLQLVLSNDRRVRERAHQTLGAVLSSAGKAFAPHLRAVVPMWWCLMYDPAAEVAAAARDAFAGAFTSERQAQLLARLHGHVAAHLAAILERPPAVIGEAASRAELQERNVRIASSALRAAVALMARIPDEAPRVAESVLGSIQPGKLAAHKAAGLRSALYAFLAAAIQHAPAAIDEGAQGTLAAVVARCLDDADPHAHRAMWDLVLCALKAFPTLWDAPGMGSHFHAKIRRFFRLGSEGSAHVSYPCVLPLLALTPPRHTTPAGLVELFAALWEGAQVHRGPADRAHALAAIAEASVFAMRDPAHDVIWTDVLLPHFRRALTHEPPTMPLRASTDLFARTLRHACALAPARHAALVASLADAALDVVGPCSALQPSTMDAAGAELPWATRLRAVGRLASFVDALAVPDGEGASPVGSASASLCGPLFRHFRGALAQPDTPFDILSLIVRLMSTCPACPCDADEPSDAAVESSSLGVLSSSVLPAFRASAPSAPRRALLLGAAADLLGPRGSPERWAAREASAAWTASWSALLEAAAAAGSAECAFSIVRRVCRHEPTAWRAPGLDRLALDALEHFPDTAELARDAAASVRLVAYLVCPALGAPVDNTLAGAASEASLLTDAALERVLQGVLSRLRRLVAAQCEAPSQRPAPVALLYILTVTHALFRAAAARLTPGRADAFTSSPALGDLALDVWRLAFIPPVALLVPASDVDVAGGERARVAWAFTPETLGACFAALTARDGERWIGERLADRLFAEVQGAPLPQDASKPVRAAIHLWLHAVRPLLRRRCAPCGLPSRAALADRLIVQLNAVAKHLGPWGPTELSPLASLTALELDPSPRRLAALLLPDRLVAAACTLLPQALQCPGAAPVLHCPAFWSHLSHSCAMVAAFAITDHDRTVTGLEALQSIELRLGPDCSLTSHLAALALVAGMLIHDAAGCDGSTSAEALLQPSESTQERFQQDHLGAFLRFFGVDDGPRGAAPHAVSLSLEPNDLPGSAQAAPFLGFLPAPLAPPAARLPPVRANEASLRAVQAIESFCADELCPWMALQSLPADGSTQGVLPTLLSAALQGRGLASLLLPDQTVFWLHAGPRIAGHALALLVHTPPACADDDTPCTTAEERVVEETPHFEFPAPPDDDDRGAAESEAAWAAAWDWRPRASPVVPRADAPRPKSAAVSEEAMRTRVASWLARCPLGETQTFARCLRLHFLACLLPPGALQAADLVPDSADLLVAPCDGLRMWAMTSLIRAHDPATLVAATADDTRAVICDALAALARVPRTQEERLPAAVSQAHAALLLAATLLHEGRGDAGAWCDDASAAWIWRLATDALGASAHALQDPAAHFRTPVALLRLQALRLGQALLETWAAYKSVAPAPPAAEDSAPAASPPPAAPTQPQPQPAQPAPEPTPTPAVSAAHLQHKLKAGLYSHLVAQPNWGVDSDSDSDSECECEHKSDVPAAPAAPTVTVTATPTSTVEVQACAAALEARAVVLYLQTARRLGALNAGGVELGPSLLLHALCAFALQADASAFASWDADVHLRFLQSPLLCVRYTAAALLWRLVLPHGSVAFSPLLFCAEGTPECSPECVGASYSRRGRARDPPLFFAATWSRFLTECAALGGETTGYNVSHAFLQMPFQMADDDEGSDGDAEDIQEFAHLPSAPTPLKPAAVLPEEWPAVHAALSTWAIIFGHLDRAMTPALRDRLQPTLAHPAAVPALMSLLRRVLPPAFTPAVLLDMLPDFFSALDRVLHAPPAAPWQGGGDAQAAMTCLALTRADQEDFRTDREILALLASLLARPLPLCGVFAPPSLLAALLLARALRLCPQAIRAWLDTQPAAFARPFERFLSETISPALIEADVRHATTALRSVKGLRLVCMPGGRELSASFRHLEASLEVVFRLHPAHPLRPPHLEGIRHDGIPKVTWRRWCLGFRVLIEAQGGSVEDALRAWLGNVEKHFEDVEECPICYTMVHYATKELPGSLCAVCKHKFHAACLAKWFTSSNSENCPMCRSRFTLGGRH